MTRPWVPESTALTTPARASTALPVAVRIPFCTVPPWMLMEADVAWLLPPKSKIPPASVSEPATDSESLPARRISEPSCTVVPPVKDAGVERLNSAPVVLMRPALPVSVAATLPLCAAIERPVARNVPFLREPPPRTIWPATSWVFPPRSNTPPLSASEPLANSRPVPGANRKVPALTVVPPEYWFSPASVRIPEPPKLKPDTTDSVMLPEKSTGLSTFQTTVPPSCTGPERLRLAECVRSPSEAAPAAITGFGSTRSETASLAESVPP